MKITKTALIIFILSLFFKKIDAQNSKSIKKDTINFIKSVNFDKEKIILDGKVCFLYEKNGNSFSINNTDNIPLITGEISSDEYGQFSSIITFEENKVKFSNSKIIGRNDLIFSLIDYYVISKDCQINKE